MPNRFVKLSDSKEWKDRLVGFCRWRIFIPKCKTCGKTNTSYTLSGTRQDAEKFAGDPECDHCDKCS